MNMVTARMYCVALDMDTDEGDLTSTIKEEKTTCDKRTITQSTSTSPPRRLSPLVNGELTDWEREFDDVRIPVTQNML